MDERMDGDDGEDEVRYVQLALFRSDRRDTGRNGKREEWERKYLNGDAVSAALVAKMIMYWMADQPVGNTRAELARRMGCDWKLVHRLMTNGDGAVYRRRETAEQVCRACEYSLREWGM